MGISLTSFNKSRGPSPPESSAVPVAQVPVEYRKWHNNTVQNERDQVNFRLEHLAFRTVLGKGRERQGISLPHPIKAEAAAPAAPWGRGLWTI